MMKRFYYQINALTEWQKKRVGSMLECNKKG